MKHSKIYVAIDWGAESGRVIAGVFDGRVLRLEEICRFPNLPIEDEEGLHWDIDRIFADTKSGISHSASRFGEDVVSIGIDTWGLDYGLIDRYGKLIGLPFHYRDSRSQGIQAEVIELLGRDWIYQQTGIQFLPSNTLYQLLAEKKSSRSKLVQAESLLFIPDLINFWLTGIKINEVTIASTSQMYNTRTGEWAIPLLESLGLHTDILCDIGSSGTILGPLLDTVFNKTVIATPEVILPGTHDTASAVAAVPANGDSWAYLSSGTWSLLGIEITEPLITPMSLKFDLTNEIGVCGTVRLLKNIMGLWLIQECRRIWESTGIDLSYDQLTQMAEEAPPFSVLIDVDYPSFLLPGNMPARIYEYCKNTNQRIPDDRGILIRTILESLALRYRMVLDSLEKASGRSIDTLHIVGGGAQNRLLNQFTANAINRPVVAGPIEATAIGNVMIQMLAKGEIGSLQQGRELIQRSFELETYYPTDTDSWDVAYQRFQELLKLVS